MRNYFDSINTKVRLLYLGLAVATAPVTSTFAILPMMSEAFEPSSVIVDSADDQVESNASQVQQQKIKMTTAQVSSSEHKTKQSALLPYPITSLVKKAN
ncbi:hypothetical protein [Psychrobacter aquaticus]|uniref:Uncharacterized protein n=1 Tax=Psychrobacter aquaticus CMS 56 TaxID=1354303 RepID=U4T9V4_9GAMM|nr:hypothetical protein [Psychrobacter aquaticus]ERL55263.1 hypothetical protein M917_1996 [Psychrobacter aquaticus CMS 56]